MWRAGFFALGASRNFIKHRTGREIILPIRVVRWHKKTAPCNEQERGNKPMTDDVKPLESKDICFVHSLLDDYGLSVGQFRVICRIARRGECTESVPNMAKGCRMNKDTVADALKFLLMNSIVNKSKRPGRTSVLTINPPGKWNPPTGKEGSAEKWGEARRKRGVTHPPEKRGDKGNPSEGNPEKDARPLKNISDGILNKDLERVKKQISDNRESCKPDKDLLACWRTERDRIQDELRARGREAIACRPAVAIGVSQEIILRPHDRNAGTYNAGRDSSGGAAKVR